MIAAFAFSFMLAVGVCIGRRWAVEGQRLKDTVSNFREES